MHDDNDGFFTQTGKMIGTLYRRAYHVFWILSFAFLTAVLILMAIRCCREGGAFLILTALWAACAWHCAKRTWLQCSWLREESRQPIFGKRFASDDAVPYHHHLRQ